jgi:predicted alpha/beta hydrolase family esterase
VACLLWFRFTTDRREDERPVERRLLVVPPESSRIPDAASTLRIDAIDGPAVRASCTQTIRIAFGDEDPYNPGQGARAYADAIGAEVDVVAGGGHLSQMDGYGPWPSLEAWCLDGAGVRLEPNFPPAGLSGPAPRDP